MAPRSTAYSNGRNGVWNLIARRVATESGCYVAETRVSPPVLLLVTRRSPA